MSAALRLVTRERCYRSVWLFMHNQQRKRPSKANEVRAAVAHALWQSVYERSQQALHTHFQHLPLTHRRLTQQDTET